MNNAGKIVKAILIVILLFCFFHPLAAILFLVSNLGVIAAIGIVYVGLRLFLGMSILSFITKSMNDKKE